MTDLLEAPVVVVSRKELAVCRLLKAAGRSWSLPMPSTDEWHGLPVLVFARRDQIGEWEQFGLIRTAYGEFATHVGPAQMAFTDEDDPVSVIVAWGGGAA